MDVFLEDYVYVFDSERVLCVLLKKMKMENEWIWRWVRLLSRKPPALSSYNFEIQHKNLGDFSWSWNICWCSLLLTGCFIFGSDIILKKSVSMSSGVILPHWHHIWYKNTGKFLLWSDFPCYWRFCVQKW